MFSHNSSPNFQNVSRVTGPAPVEGWRELPALRSLFLPDEGCRWVQCDASQQEIRLLAHFEDGALQQAYQENPELDVHKYAQDLINSLTGLGLERKAIKVLGFGMIYGMGAGGLSKALGVPVEKARVIREAYLTALPGVRKLLRALKMRAAAGEPIRTVGGRVYHAEEPKVVNGEVRSFDYKLLNYLIQGSAADLIKDAIINYEEHRSHGRFLLSVHDELDVSIPTDYLMEETLNLVHSIETTPLDVQMLSEFKIGPNWGAVE